MVEAGPKEIRPLAVVTGGWRARRRSPMDL